MILPRASTHLNPARKSDVASRPRNCGLIPAAGAWSLIKSVMPVASRSRAGTSIGSWRGRRGRRPGVCRGSCAVVGWGRRGWAPVVRRAGARASTVGASTWSASRGMRTLHPDTSAAEPQPNQRRPRRSRRPRLPALSPPDIHTLTHSVLPSVSYYSEHLASTAVLLACLILPVKLLIFSKAFNICWFFAFSLCFSIWRTSVMHLGSRYTLSNRRTELLIWYDCPPGDSIDSPASLQPAQPGTSAGFWGEENFENLTTKWCILQYVWINICGQHSAVLYTCLPWLLSNYNINIENCSFCMFSLFNFFSSIFQGVRLLPDPFTAICPYARTPVGATERRPTQNSVTRTSHH